MHNVGQDLAGSGGEDYARSEMPDAADDPLARRHPGRDGGSGDGRNHWQKRKHPFGHSLKSSGG
jgi:hypothetical protein